MREIITNPVNDDSVARAPEAMPIGCSAVMQTLTRPYPVTTPIIAVIVACVWVVYRLTGQA